MCRCTCDERRAPARGPKVPLYWITDAGLAWLASHPLPPLPTQRVRGELQRVQVMRVNEC
jgi:hypothetical protein